MVTGGAGAIGSAISERLAQAGWYVVVCDLRGDAATSVADTLQGLGVEIDICDPSSVLRGLHTVAEAAGPVAALINCAGWDALTAFHNTDEDFQAHVLDINLHGPIRITREVVRGMLNVGHGGSILNVVSEAGRVGQSYEAIYSAAKGGLIAFTKAIAREYASQGINSNAVSPGPIDTPLMRESLAASDGSRSIESMAKVIPMHRIGVPEDVAAAVEFLTSPGASYITGQVLSVSGGLTMQ
jgi:2-hydroxycyclohexanecarboxyl-CoA dehydrogenase